MRLHLLTYGSRNWIKDARFSAFAGRLFRTLLLSKWIFWTYVLIKLLVKTPSSNWRTAPATYLRLHQYILENLLPPKKTISNKGTIIHIEKVLCILST